MKLRLFSGSVMAAAVAFLMAGCASTAHIEKDDSVDFGNYKSFTWTGSKEGKKNNLTEKKITEAVSAELVKAGWKQNDRNPDVLLAYDVLVEKNLKETSEPVYSRPYTRYIYNPNTRRYISLYYPSQFLGYDRREEEVREGTITITMIDAKTDKIVWQGWTTGEVNSKNLTSKEISQAVKSIFRKFDMAKN